MLNGTRKHYLINLFPEFVVVFLSQISFSRDLLAVVANVNLHVVNLVVEVLDDWPGLLVGLLQALNLDKNLLYCLPKFTNCSCAYCKNMLLNFKET